MDTIGAEMRRDCCFSECARIKDSSLQVWREQCSHVRSGGNGGQRICRGIRAGESGEDYGGSAAGHFCINTVVRRIVREAVAAANYRFSRFRIEQAFPGRPCESYSRAPAILRRWKGRESCCAQRKTRIPERIAAGLQLGGQLVKNIRRLPIIGPGQSQVEDKVRRQLEIVANV